LKKVVFFGWYKFVSAYVEGDKKKFEKMVFCSYPSAHLIDFWSQGTQIDTDFLDTD